MLSNADTAIVSEGIFFHYCHKIKGLMALRICHECCPFCLQKNPDYIPNKIIYTVINYKTNSVILAFDDQLQAVKYIQTHHLDPLMLGDTGFVR